MSIAEAIDLQRRVLHSEMWRRLGPQKHGVGRRVVSQAVDMMVQHWPEKDMLDREHRAAAMQALKFNAVSQFQGYEGRDKRYGFFWTMVLSAVLSQLVRLLLEWWIATPDNKRSFEYMQLVVNKEVRSAG